LSDILGHAPHGDAPTAKESKQMSSDTSGGTSSEQPSWPAQAGEDAPASTAQPEEFSPPAPGSWSQPTPDSWVNAAGPPEPGLAGFPPGSQTPSGQFSAPGQSPSDQFPPAGQYPADQYPQGGQYPAGQYPQGGQYPAGQYPQGGQYAPGAQYPAGQFPQGVQYPAGQYPAGQYPQGGQFPQGGQYPPGYPAGQGPAGQYGYQPQYLTPAPVRNNPFAIVALCCGIGQFVLGLAIVGNIVGAVPAIIFGALSLKQIKLRGERGRGMAIAGLVLGILGVLYFLLIITLIVVGSTVHTSGGSS
jgi:hypothetical protein